MGHRSRHGLAFLAIVCVAVAAWSAQAAEPRLSVAPPNPEFGKRPPSRFITLAGATPDGSDRKYALGYIPGPVDLSHTAKQAGQLGHTSQFYPASYDLRTQGKLTPVKDQNPAGACWTFATCASLESYLLPGATWDFSENNMKNTHGFDYAHDAGGQMWMSTAYLARWSGPVSESDDPYDPYSGTSPPGLSPQKHVQEVLFLPPRASATDNDAIKLALMTYGAVYTAFYWASGSYSAANAAYYYSGSSTSNHAVAIVGWDDSFDKSKFPSAPPDNGAFIIKNSWGTSFGEAGYFYISYYDSKVGMNENSVFQNAEATTNYARVYQYDPLGWVTDLGYGATTAWGANVFTAAAAEQVSAVSFYTAAPNTSYTVYIYRNPTAEPIGGSALSTQTDTIASTGYHTVALSTPVPLTAGDRFSVVIRFTTPGHNFPVPVEYATVDGNGDPYSTGATASAGQSYVSPDGTAWSDLTGWDSTANACIKAFTNPGPPTAPSDLTHTGNALDSITWSWTDASGDEDGFRGHDAAHAVVWTEPQDATSHEEAGLSANTQYTRHVHAYNAGGDSSPSNTYSAYTSIEEPTIDADSFGTVTATSIQVHSSTALSNLASGTSGLQIRNATTSALSAWKQDNSDWTSSGLTANTQYSFDAHARNGDGDETGWCVSAAKYTLPAAPAVSCDRNASDPGHPLNAVFTFTNSAGWGGGGVAHCHYVWDQSPTHAFTGAEPAWSSGTLPQTGSAAGDWYLHLLSHNPEEASGGTLDSGPYRVFGAPVATAMPAYTQGTSNTLQWGALAGASEYYAEVDTSDSFPSPDANSGWIAGTSWPATGLADGQIYCYRVKARTANGESDWSNVVSSTQDASPPASAVSALASPQTVASFTVSWTRDDATSGVALTRLYYSYEGGAYAEFGSGYAGTSTTFTSPDGDGTYAFYTRATDNVDNVEDAPGTPDQTIEVDATPPTSSAGPVDTEYGTQAVSVPYTASDGNGTGVSSVTLWYRRRSLLGGAWGDWTQFGGDFTASPIAFDSSTTGGNGEYEFYTVATDGVGHTEAAPASADAWTRIVFLNPPTLDAEPEFTPGTTNQVSWAGIPGDATHSKVECAADPDFNTILDSSVWLGKPQNTYTFTNLVEGTEYYYRVRAGRQLLAPDAMVASEPSAAVSSTQLTILEVSVDQAADEPGQTNTRDWFLGTIRTGTSQILPYPQRFVVASHSNVLVDLGLRVKVADDRGLWSAGSAAGHNTYVMSGIFDTRTDSTPAPEEFVANDVLGGATIWADEGAGALCADGAGTRDGTAVPIEGTTGLFLRFDAPTSLDRTDSTSHTITLEVSCMQTP